MLKPLSDMHVNDRRLSVVNMHVRKFEFPGMLKRCKPEGGDCGYRQINELRGPSRDDFGSSGSADNVGCAN